MLSWVKVVLFLVQFGSVGHHLVSAVKVLGNSFVDSSGNKIILRGVSHSGSEYACVQKWGILEGSVDAQAVAAIKSWGNNIVRIPLNEDCWLGINGVPSQYAGDNYIKAINDYTTLITKAGMVAILDLHWTATGSTLATKQDPMPDSGHSIAFWTDVATYFANQSNVVFELFNEPFPGNGDVGAGQWACWKNGSCSTSSNVGFPAAGMDQLVRAVRGAGATNVIIAGSLVWSNHMDGWLDYVPKDPLNNLAAVWHSYDFNACNNQDCWEKTVSPIAAKYPVIVTESGFKIDYSNKLWTWLETNKISYMAWTWNTWKGEGLITDYAGTPSDPWGKAWMNQLKSVNANAV